MDGKLLIIDGHSMAYRAFYAMRSGNFQTSTGQDTSAVFGFIRMLTKILKDENPTRVAVAFDVSRHSFRTDKYPEYKGTRDETPPEFHGQVDLIDAFLEAMGICRLRKENIEADDILATLAHTASQQGLDVVVASGDRDAFQMANEHVTILYPGQSMSDLRRMTPEAIEEKYGVPPQRYPELAALVGETADNLPGVPGVGPKTAATWINRFDGLENVLARADEIGGKRGTDLRAHIDDVRRNRSLNRLLTDVDLGITLDDLYRRPTEHSEAMSLCDSLEFGPGTRREIVSVASIALNPSAPDALVNSGGSAADEGGAEESLILDDVEIIRADANTNVQQVLATFEAETSVGIWCEGVANPPLPDLEHLAIASGMKVLLIDAREVSTEQTAQCTQWLAHLTRPLIAHDLKTLVHMMRAWDVETLPVTFDVALGAYLLRPEQRSYAIDDLAEQYLGVHITALEEEESGQQMLDLDGESEEKQAAARRQMAQRAAVLPYVADALRRAMNDDERTLLDDVEQPVARMLERMEHVGIAIDSAELDLQRQELSKAVEGAAQRAYDAIGHTVNLSSPKQLQQVLFDELDMPRTKKTKTGYTTNAEALETLFAKTRHPFLEHLLTHRDRIKLSQMTQSLHSAIADDGRIHTTFSQIATATGRLASSEPNLQNIPARTPDGMRIRHAFVAGEGWQSLMSVDYSQIEMRIMAHLSNDEGLIDAFNSGEDLHRTMASMVFDTPVDQVTSEQRSRIKATSYGLAYGLSSYGLSAQLGIGVPEAAELRERYFERFGGVRDYLDGIVEQAQKDGFTQTMFGRRRYLPDLTSDNRQRREIAKRAALNAPIQGSAADIIKIAMVGVDSALRDEKLRSRILLQIHDELILEIAEGEAVHVEELVRENMAYPPLPHGLQTARAPQSDDDGDVEPTGQEESTDHTRAEHPVLALRVPLDVAVGIGHSWKEAAH